MSVAERVRLGDVASIDRRTVKPEQIQPGDLYVGLEHIDSDGGVAPVEVESGELRSNKFRFEPEHVLYGKLRPYLAKIARPSGAGVCSTDILPVKAGPDLDRDYMHHYLRTPRMVAVATEASTGANLPRLSPKALAEFRIPLPSLDQQRRIAAVLDAADELRAKRRQAIAKLDTLAQSIFIDMFGDPVINPMGFRDHVQLGEIADVRSGITKGRKTGTAELQRVPYLAVANVQDGEVRLEALKTIEATAAEISKYSLLSGDLVLTEGGDPDKLGRGAVWRDEVVPCIHQNHVFRVRLTDHSYVPEFVSHLLGSERGKRYFLRMAKQTTGIASINMSQLKRFPLLSPSKDLQQCYVERIGGVSAALAQLERSAVALDQLFASLQQRAFLGEL